MDSELIISGYTYREGIVQINNAISGMTQINGITTNYTMAPGPYNVVDSDATIVKFGPGAINLPSAGSAVKGRILVIKNSSGVVINITPDGPESIDGVAAPYLLLNGECITIQYRLGTWYIISKKL